MFRATKVARFRCERFPNGVANIRTTQGIVRFEDGKAEVTNAELAEALRGAPEVFGIVEVVDDAPSPRARSKR